MSVSHRPARGGHFGRGLRLSLIEIVIVAGGVLAAGMAGIATRGLLPL